METTTKAAEKLVGHVVLFNFNEKETEVIVKNIEQAFAERYLVPGT